MEHYILVKWNLDAPERFDRSEIHSEWKRQFGQKIEKKAIFDCFGRERK